MISEKRVTYTSGTTYSVLNEIGPKTKNVWLVFHGLGHLSRYFIRHFSVLDRDENFVIAPQAPSKYYQDTNYRHVGASWLTREDTLEETKNVLNYIDAVWEAEKPGRPFKLIVLGYSQGVSIATRWLSSRKLSCDHLILHSGGIPRELEPGDFEHFHSEVNVEFWYGNKDEYISQKRFSEEKNKGLMLFGNRLKIVEFEGAHDVNTQLISEFVRNI